MSIFNPHNVPAGKRRFLRQWLYLLFLCLGLLGAGPVLADERILDYQADILVHVDGELLVTETIRVRAEGEDIRRGIYRDFPTRYTDRFGNRYRVRLDIVDVKRDGASEPYHTENRSNGVRIYIGDPNRMVGNGIHEYQLRYRTNRQLGFFADHDELYWNVTGNGWMFPIDHAGARIELPADVSSADLQTSFYTGPQGAQGQDARSEITNGHTVVFETTRALQPYEGLTVAVGWPKGIVRQPSSAERIGWFLQDNRAALVLLIGWLATFGWYLWAWNRAGRDPEKGVIIPLFKPPMGMTPAACSYVLNMSFNRQAFAAAVVSLGVKGYLEIEEQKDGFKLRKKTAPPSGKASRGENALLGSLFMLGNEIEMDQKNHRSFIKGREGLRQALKTEYLGRLFILNTIDVLPAALLTIVAAVIAAAMPGGPFIWVPYAILSVALHVIFLYLLRAPTPAGRQIMDQIEGFRMYLDTAEQDRLERMQSPQLTPEVFETFLPYAFALGVENSWCDRFARELPEEMEKRGGYQPNWYSGRSRGLNTLGHLGSDFNSSFSTAIASASSPPGSSSGSGGGGSSGGGGGGGGGGGW
jgi:uncharacterized membrane protein YgcG